MEEKRSSAFVFFKMTNVILTPLFAFSLTYIDQWEDRTSGQTVRKMPDESRVACCLQAARSFSFFVQGHRKEEVTCGSAHGSAAAGDVKKCERSSRIALPKTEFIEDLIQYQSQTKKQMIYQEHKDSC